MKKSAAFLLVLMMAVSMAACGSGNTAQSTGSSAAETGRESTVKETTVRESTTKETTARETTRESTTAENLTRESTSGEGREGTDGSAGIESGTTKEGVLDETGNDIRDDISGTGTR